MVVNIAAYTEYPGLRNCDLSDKSGEDFYHTVLNKAFKEALDAGENLIVNLDGTAGYASSFLDEAFGNLIYDYTKEKVSNTLQIISTEEPQWKTMIEGDVFSKWEQRRTQNGGVRVTCTHPAWYRNINGKIELRVWEVPAV